MTQPFLSIVTISFNQAQYLRQCVESVVSQKGDDVEYIVVDPGSADGSREILESYGDAIDHLVLEPDDGPADGLNKGFARATGQVGYFINSDDFLLPGAVARMRRLSSENPDIDVLLGGAWMVDGHGEPIRELTATSADLFALLAGDAKTVQQGFFFRINTFRGVGGFNTANRTCWDFELICRLLHQGRRAQVTRERFGGFRVYGDSISGGIGGTKHTVKYLADRDRLHCELTGRPYAAKTPGQAVLARARCSLKRPSMTLASLVDRMFPSQVRRRFEADLADRARSR